MKPCIRISPRALALLAAAAVTTLGFAGTNPLYQDSGATGMNPLFELSSCTVDNGYATDYFSSGDFALQRYKTGSGGGAGKVNIQDLHFTCSPGSSSMSSRISSLMSSAPDSRSCSVSFLDNPLTKTCSIYRFDSSSVSSWSSPPCDVTISKPATQSCTIRCDSGFSISRGKWPASSLVTKQKAWLCSNFRFEIDGLGASTRRVTKIDSFTIKQGIADLDGDGKLDFTISDLVFEAPIDTNIDFDTWLSLADERSCTLSFLGTDGSVLQQISCDFVIPVSLSLRSSSTCLMTCAFRGPLHMQ